ncbi:MAG: AraC family transcriptional regulator [Bacteroidales bacterium]|nr:AraC family transcriptional regulator [Bacteroidales bacterium]
MKLTSESLKEVIAHSPKEIYKTKGTLMSISCSEGWCKFKVDNGEEFSMKKNDCIHYGYEINIVWATVSDDFEAWALICQYDEIESMDDAELKIDLNRLVFRPRVISLDDDTMEACAFISKRMYALVQKGDSVSLAMTKHYIKILICGASALLRKLGVNTTETKREHIISDKFIDLVSENFKQSRKENFYADLLGINPKYLTIVVKKATGRAPCEWIDDYNLYYIKKQLANKSISVQEICYELDFATPSHFTKFFKDKTGMTPSTYRKQLENI